MTITTGSLVEISLNELVLGQQMSQVFQYRVLGMLPTVSAVQLAEAWWNHTKTTTRALCQGATFASPFKTVLIREMNDSAGDYATFDIPVVEQTGTRTSGSGEAMPPYVSTATRLVVGSRTTRPGQKRMPFVLEGDNVSGLLQADLLGKTQTWAALITATMTLGAPAATVELHPIVCRKDAAGFVTAYQDITGYLVNGYLSTQNSRKYGRGI